MNDSPGVIEQLIARIESLEHRVSALERHPLERSTSASSQLDNAQPLVSTPATVVLDSVSVFSVLGRAMLGIAGAYLLRAAAESNLLPSAIAAAIAIPYAIAWLFLAVRSRAGEWLPAIVYSVTSAAILAPLLWELTFRFQIFSAPANATMIAVYYSAATALAWRKSLSPVLWVASIAAVLIALGLFFASRSTTPYVTVLLLMLALAAFVESRDRAPGLRAFTALATSVALWAAVYIYINPPGTRPDYPILSPAALIIPTLILFTLYLASVIYNTTALRLRITVFEVIQTLIAFLLVAVALDAFGPRSSLHFFGFFCLALAAGSYAAVYLFFDRVPQPRNYRVFSTWSAALTLTGCALAVPDSFQAPCFSLAAVVATVLGARFTRFVLIFHGAIYLAAGAIASGLAAYTFYALASALPTAPSWPIYVAFLAAVVCYIAAPRFSSPSWQQQGIQLLVAALAICSASALVVHLLMGLASLRIQAGPHHLAFFRTISVCFTALTLAFVGARFDRIELTRLANAALVLLAIKLVAEDLRYGHLAYIAGSIFLFALTLIAVPRAARAAHRPHPRRVNVGT